MRRSHAKYNWKYNSLPCGCQRCGCLCPEHSRTWLASPCPVHDSGPTENRCAHLHLAVDSAENESTIVRVGQRRPENR